jgi:hypothetical protein
MTKAQQIAFANPCARGEETVADKFWRGMKHKGELLSVLLTVNK